MIVFLKGEPGKRNTQAILVGNQRHDRQPEHPMSNFPHLSLEKHVIVLRMACRHIEQSFPLGDDE